MKMLLFMSINLRETIYYQKMVSGLLTELPRFVILTMRYCNHILLHLLLVLDTQQFNNSQRSIQKWNILQVNYPHIILIK